MKKFNYENKKYLEKLDALSSDFYAKYLYNIGKYARNKKVKILDVGCGNGTVLNLLKESGYKNIYGVDVSGLFVANAKKKGLTNIFKYNGSKLPFQDFSFDIIGSFNVLEHTLEPEVYLEDQTRKLKRGGFLIVACPNFLTPILKTQHRRIAGIKNRIANMLLILSKLTRGNVDFFERLEPVNKRIFEYDDDSIVITNPLDLREILLKNNCSIIHESGFINTRNALSDFIDSIGILRYMMPSCFLVVQKNS